MLGGDEVRHIPMRLQTLTSMPKQLPHWAPSYERGQHYGRLIEVVFVDINIFHWVPFKVDSAGVFNVMGRMGFAKFRMKMWGC